ncbi:MAG: hypothetical protein A2268_16855 [Candidatus Raymondbacteria bacterium RifOxyA12_full_50_37]|uniref:D-alanine--D-alanine ligase n=1 Tax=Candidatus Raymondbacteria bacterium RIFOXYD12_FULL_49_13 TaxID=1817890 RepID=A0A1F7FCH7_UNCRA|nr:MAG: hypothetical protein A2268_16855 [Candidatus Raymondbacteria bacterium RifOxyA12_full_50_37]OGJ86280.1 MAG: hypothetical protein A2248_16450 [Candidatus Raymondbacteria bacterium RIFOXYA2_FULL_49_16]OGJ93616.1 MAG: hypothetical protein A2487_20160 [Candidatus Raymondbacteria bacterium RifOxyC12_full_50_8]OGJ95817.1 MAG: hypothetical protein A2453_11765 [Candidatus Raymondbacteria bacterium RIFOXYC2_FULL_50_21]OGJ99052.1 MAG: hypothetical protein A2350_17315 [Candidatus Raymondbacteria b
MNKTRVAVIMGGTSGEHPVSLKSGNGIVNNLDYTEYATCPVIIGTDGMWHCAGSYADYEKNNPFDSAAFLKSSSDGTPYFPPFLLLAQGKPDIVFPIVHGTGGEDGTLQGLLEIYGLPYTGSGVLGSSLAMHKRKAKELYIQYGLTTPDYSYYTREQWRIGAATIPSHVTDKLGLPVFVKIPTGGSSIGMGMAQSRDEIRDLCERFFSESREVLFEKAVKGTEVSCGVLDSADGEPEALAVTEIVPVKAAFFDYEAKYEKGASREITPARISADLTQKVHRAAVMAHKALHCSGFSRSDIIIANQKLYTLETNTLPGFTETSLLPQMAAASGLTYAEFLDRIIQQALARAR